MTQAASAKAKSPSSCRRASTHRSTTSGRSARPGSGARIARKIPGSRTRRASSPLIHETVSHVVVLYWMDRARRDLVLQAPHHYSERRGTFALRSPVRPNPIAISVARIVGIEGCTLTVVGLDCVDNTPLLDLKPYFASTDSVPEAAVGWHDGLKR
jgi:hypothetical protein